MWTGPYMYLRTYVSKHDFLLILCPTVNTRETQQVFSIQFWRSQMVDFQATESRSGTEREEDGGVSDGLPIGRKISFLEDTTESRNALGERTGIRQPRLLRSGAIGVAVGGRDQQSISMVPERTTWDKRGFQKATTER